MARKKINAYDSLKAGQGETPKTHFPVLDILETSLTAIRDLDTDLIDDWGPVDRLEESVTVVTPSESENAFEQLKENISSIGQQVPILVRPNREKNGRFEIIYGRRRLKACKALGITVKANVTDIDDQTALLAKASENGNRRDLSFYEKALFAQQIQGKYKTASDLGHAIGTSRYTVQHLKKVTNAIPSEVGYLIGPAPNKGRRQWFQLVELFENGKANTQSAISLLKEMTQLNSDERLERLVQTLSEKSKSQKQIREPLKGVKIKVGQGTATVSAKGAFAEWLNERLDDVLKELHQEFEAVTKTEE